MKGNVRGGDYVERDNTSRKRNALYLLAYPSERIFVVMGGYVEEGKEKGSDTQRDWLCGEGEAYRRACQVGYVEEGL